MSGHLRQIKDNLYSYISWSCQSLMFCILIMCERKQFWSKSDRHGFIIYLEPGIMSQTMLYLLFYLYSIYYKCCLMSRVAPGTVCVTGVWFMATTVNKTLTCIKTFRFVCDRTRLVECIYIYIYFFFFCILGHTEEQKWLSLATLLTAAWKTFGKN